MKKYLKSYAIVALGSVIFALAFDWFFAPNQVAMGGITGLAQVIKALVPWLSVGVLAFVLNVPLFLAGWKYIGFHLLASSLFSMLVSSVAIDAIAAVYAFPAMDPMLATLCGGALMGLGLGIVFSQGATTGGTDVVARLLKLRIPWLPMGKLMLAPRLCGACAGGGGVRRHGSGALRRRGAVCDHPGDGYRALRPGYSKVAYIISDEWKAVSDMLMGDLDRGVTLLQGEGGYTGTEKKVLLVAFKQKEIVDIKRRVHDIDPDAFMIVCDAHDVLGEGFGNYRKEDI